MSWDTSVADLRSLLSDGPTDKYFYRKQCFGDINGTNVNFKTFEYRRVTDFTAPTGFLGVYVNSVLVTVSVDDTTTGEFQVASAPVDGARIEATYYAQWFIDSELTEFILTANRWLGKGDDPTTLDPGLIPSALKYASGEAYQKLSLKWIQRISETFRVEDSVDPKNQQLVNPYAQAALNFKKEADELRDDFYQRQGQPLAPLFRSIGGRVREITPKR